MRTERFKCPWCKASSSLASIDIETDDYEGAYSLNKICEQCHHQISILGSYHLTFEIDDYVRSCIHCDEQIAEIDSCERCGCCSTCCNCFKEE